MNTYIPSVLIYENVVQFPPFLLCTKLQVNRFHRFRERCNFKKYNQKLLILIVDCMKNVALDKMKYCILYRKGEIRVIPFLRYFGILTVMSILIVSLNFSCKIYTSVVSCLYIVSLFGRKMAIIIRTIIFKGQRSLLSCSYT